VNIIIVSDFVLGNIMIQSKNHDEYGPDFICAWKHDFQTTEEQKKQRR
jgi:hypothetical protein